MNVTVIFSVYKDKYEGNTGEREDVAKNFLQGVLGLKVRRCSGKFKGKSLPSLIVYGVDYKCLPSLSQTLCEMFEQESMLVINGGGEGRLVDAHGNIQGFLGTVTPCNEDCENHTKVGDFRFTLAKVEK